MENKEENNEAGPSIINTPEFMTSKKSSIILLSNNKSEFSIDIEINNNKLNLFLNQNENQNLSLKKSYTLEELKKISRVFTFFDGLNDVFGYLSDLLENKKIELNSDDNQNLNNFYLSFSFEIPFPKKKEIVKLFLDKYEMSKLEESKMIKNELFQLRKEINILKEENKILQKKLENNTQNNNNNNNINFEEIINVLIDEKLKNKNNSANPTNEAELESINAIINMTNDEYQKKFKTIEDKVKNIDTRLIKIETDDLSKLKRTTNEEIESLKSFINTNNEDIQQIFTRLNTISPGTNIYDQLIAENKCLKQEVANLNTIVNQFNDGNTEEIQSIKLLVNEINNSIGFGYGNNQNKKENNISKLIQIIKKNNTEYQNKEIQAKLLYNSLKDGGDCKTFHTLCNNIPNTFTLVKTTKGAKFGFFRSIAINANGPWLQDNKSFFISLNKNKIYKIKEGKLAVKFDDTYFINTISFSLSGNIFKDKFLCPNKETMNQNFEGFTEEFELNCGEKEFYIKKLEVYQLEF